MSWIEYAQAAGMIFAASLAIQLGLILVLCQFIALAQTPDRRALFTTAPAYLVTLVLGVSSIPAAYVAYVPFAILPAAFLTYLYWRWTFRKAWYSDQSMIPEGMTAANEDWRVGLWFIGAALLAAIVRVAIRQASGN